MRLTVKQESRKASTTPEAKGPHLHIRRRGRGNLSGVDNRSQGDDAEQHQVSGNRGIEKGLESYHPPCPKSPPPRHLAEPQLQNDPPRRLRRHIQGFRHHLRRHQRPRHHQLDQLGQS